MEVEGKKDLHPVRFTAQKFSTGYPFERRVGGFQHRPECNRKGKASISNCEENTSRPV